MTPLKMYNLIDTLKPQFKTPLHVHCHNDLGMATANALMAFKAGAKVIDVTINGIGERTGITSLAEVATALKILFDVDNDWKLNKLPQLSKTVEQYSKIKCGKLSPVTGEYAFTHNAGLHVSALVEDPSFYETIPCERVGRERQIVVDKMASKATIRYKLKKLGIQPRQAIVKELLAEIKKRESNWLNETQVRKLAKGVTNGVTC